MSIACLLRESFRAFPRPQLCIGGCPRFFALFGLQEIWVLVKKHTHISRDVGVSIPPPKAFLFEKA